MLDLADIQRTVTGRLDRDLRERWTRKSAELIVDKQEEDLPFSDFCACISGVAQEKSWAGV